jgi:hypothetical protein
VDVKIGSNYLCKRSDLIGVCGPMKCVHKNTDITIPKYMGVDFNTSIQERTYFQNVHHRMLVVPLCKGEIKHKKAYTSWGDVFRAFKSSLMTNVCTREGKRIVFSRSFSQLEFFLFCSICNVFIKDGLSFNVRLLGGDLYQQRSDKLVIMVSLKRPIAGRCIAYRKAYIWFRDKHSV